MTAAAMEANETYRVAQNTITQTPTPITVTSGVRANSAPAEVATPFPPRNFSQGEYTCPSTLHIAAIIPNISGEFHSGCPPGAVSIEILTAAKPFKKSSANTG